MGVISLFASCSGRATYWIDNPTEEPIEVSIDNETPVTILPGEFKRMNGSLSPGEHTMKISGGEAIPFYSEQKQGILNPTLSTYVMVLQEYGTGTASTDHDTIICIDGVTFHGPFPLVTNAPFIYTGNVDFLVDTPFKNEITTSGSGRITLSKLFRKEDFIHFYKKNYR